MAFEVGNEKRVKFWRDSWYEDVPLRVAFPTLFSIATSKETWVEEVWDGSMGGGC